MLVLGAAVLKQKHLMCLTVYKTGHPFWLREKVNKANIFSHPPPSFLISATCFSSNLLCHVHKSDLSNESMIWLWSCQFLRHCATHNPSYHHQFLQDVRRDSSVSINRLLASLQQQRYLDSRGILYCLISSWANTLYRFYTSKSVCRSWGALLHMWRKMYYKAFRGRAKSDQLTASVWTEDYKFEI